MAASSSSTAAWEQPGGAPWEAPDYGEASSDEEEDPNKNPRAAANMFLDMVVELYLESKLSAKQLCEMCWWASRAGMAGELVQEYALRPGQKGTGNYQRHLDNALGLNREEREFHILACPGHPRSEAFGRRQMKLPFRPPHELFEDMLAEEPGTLLQLQEQVEAGQQPPAYHDHPVVRGAAEGEA
eukprot:1694005-Alexandrium_andersonii.AAC.1